MKRILMILLTVMISLFSFGQNKNPNIIIISLDTFRPDRIEVYGDKKNLTPNLNKFSRESLTFTNAITETPLTLPSHAILMTGCFMEKTALFDNGIGTLSPKVKTIAEVLRDKGYETRAYVSADTLKSKFGLSRGFRIYDDSFGITKRRFAEGITNRAISFLSEKNEKPIFLWLHYFDTHSPYLTPETPPGTIQGNYDDAVSYIDKNLGKVFEYIPENTIVFIVSDHGEGLNEHKEPTHGLLLYQSTLSTCLMVRGKDFKSGLNDKFRTLADVAPTIYKIVGVKVENLDGKLLDEDGERIVPLSTLLPLDEYRWKPLFGATDGRYKWIKGDNLKLFDLQNDKKETTDISKIAPKESLKLKDYIPKIESINLDFASFSSLGYLSGTPGKNVDIAKLKDPESMMDVFSEIEKMGNLRIQEKHQEAVNLAFEIVKKDGSNPSVLFALGDSLRHIGKVDEAIKYLDESLKISPALVPAYVSKGFALMAKDKKEEAAKMFETAIKYDSDATEAINPLIAYYLDLNKPEIALPMLEETVTKGIATTDTYLMRGRVHLIQKKPELAEDDFKNALSLSQNEKETLKSIGDIFLMRGYLDRAKAIYLEGIKRYPNYKENYLTLGAYYMTYDQYNDALKIFEKTLTLDLTPQEKKNVSEIVEGLKAILNKK
jgi:arylsulfatase A-like enzyme/Tfp pilus assembly protein PilF